MGIDEIDGEEMKRRIDRVSQMRAAILELRRSAMTEYKAGRSSDQPQWDIRSDAEYWRALAEENAGKEEKEPLIDD